MISNTNTIFFPFLLFQSKNEPLSPVLDYVTDGFFFPGFTLSGLHIYEKYSNSSREYAAMNHVYEPLICVHAKARVVRNAAQGHIYGA